MDRINRFVSFYTTNNIAAWEGVRRIDETNVLASGALNSRVGCFYIGPVNGSSASLYEISVPRSITSSAYGPDVYDKKRGILRLVGTYKNETPFTLGFLFKGTVNDINNENNFKTIRIGYNYTYCHSIIKDLIVGNSDDLYTSSNGETPLGPAKAFIYNIKTKEVTFIEYPGAKSNTVYGVCYNGGDSYTMCGGHTPVTKTVVNIEEGNDREFEEAYIVDFNSVTKQFTHFTSYRHPPDTRGIYNTHFQGISNENGYYQLVADSLNVESKYAPASWVGVRRNVDGSFGQAQWLDIAYPSGDDVTVTSANSVAGNLVIGVAESLKIGTKSYQAEILAL
jgi:hypothetical protein